MRFDILTLFPDFFTTPLQSSILRRAQEKALVQIAVHDIRDYTTDAHRTVDDTPYGGGTGMVMKVDVMADALAGVQNTLEIAMIPAEKRRIVLLTPQGQRFNQKQARYASSQYEQITLICGHYEGFDERIRNLVDVELSIGDFVLTGGEGPALLVCDAISRLLPGVISEGATDEETFSLEHEGEALVEYPHYTRPLEYLGNKVPEILVSGNHAAIAAWRKDQAKARTEVRKLDQSTEIL